MIAGCDYSTRAIDIVVLDEDTDRATWHRFPMEAATPFLRAQDVRFTLPPASWWDEQRVGLIALEEPRGHLNAVTLLALGSLYGAIAARLPRGIPAVALTPAEWKRAFVGNGNARKHDVRACAVRLGFGEELNMAQDAYDAFGIGWAARELHLRDREAA